MAENVLGSSVRAKVVVDEWQNSTWQENISYAGIAMTWSIQAKENTKHSGCRTRLKKYAEGWGPKLATISLLPPNQRACIGKLMRSLLTKRNRLRKNRYMLSARC
jgi:hypothetical protein